MVARLATSFVVLALMGCGVTVDTDADGFASPVDCDDSNPEVFPGAEDLPDDGIDQDCDGDDATEDADADGHRALWAGGDDCNDARAGMSPSAEEICGDGVDQDCDGADLPCPDVDMDGDGFAPVDGDCDDADSDVHPDAVELPYNGRDDDCDPATADDDLDGDGFSTRVGGDCDDDDASVFPGAPETPYDGIDQDCSGSDLRDVDRDGFTGGPAGDDCDDLRPDINPGAPEIPYDRVDQDCDGSDLIGASVVVGSATGAQDQPDVAFGAGVYLVAWRDRRTASEIYGRIVDPSGARVGAEILIGADTGSSVASSPSVAFDGSRFLVVWDETPRMTFDGGIIGRFVGTDGSTTEPSFVIATNGFNRSLPAVGFGGGTYLVGWLLNTTIMDRRIQAVPVGTDGVVGSRTDVHSSSEATLVPTIDIASDGTTFLVVWHRTAYCWVPSGARGTFARLVGADGLPLGTETQVSTQGGSPICSSPAGSSASFNGTNYLVVTAPGDGVYGQLLDPSLGFVGTTASTNFEITLGSGQQRDPAVALVGGDFLVAFRDTRWPFDSIYGQRVDSAGGLVGSDLFNNVPILVPPTPASRPRIAAGTTGALLVVALDGDIHALVVSP